MKLEHDVRGARVARADARLLLDAERVVPCMPGATLTEVVDDRTWKAEMGVKLGPVGMQFLVDVTLLDRDDDAHTVRLGRERARHARQGRRRGHGRLGPRRGRHRAPASRWPPTCASPARSPSSGGPAWCRTSPTSSSDQFAECIKAQLSASPEAAAAAVDGGTEAGLRLLTGGRGARVGDQTTVRPWTRPRRGEVDVKRITVTVNGVRHERGGGGARAPRLLPARGARADRHERRVRHLHAAGPAPCTSTASP